MKILTELIQKHLGQKNLTAKMLAPLDQQHIGGLSSCQLISDALSPAPQSHILDSGSGWGGPARYIAQQHDCNVHGIDIDQGNCDIAAYLSALTEHNAQTTFEAISATKYQTDQKFDSAYMLHTSMCIKDKEALIRTIYDAIKPSAKFIIFDIFKTTADDELTYPIPWAKTLNSSFLEPSDQMINRLKKHGFHIEKEDSFHDYALEKVSAGLELITQHEFWAEATALHLGENYHQKMQNLYGALLAKKCAPHMIIALKKNDGDRHDSQMES